MEEEIKKEEVVEEKIEWRKKNLNEKSEFVEKVEAIVSGVVMSELNNINSKIEMLISMGLIQDGPQVQELREQMKQLQTGTPK